MPRLPSVSTLLLAAACSAGPAPDVATTPVTTRIGLGAGGAVNLRQSMDQVAIAAELRIPADSAFALLRAVYAELQLAVGRDDPRSRTVAVVGAKVRRRLGGVPLTRYLDCGAKYNIPNAETYDVELSITSQITPKEDGSSQVTTLVQAAANDPVHGTDNQVNCTSLSALEMRIADGIRQRAGLATRPPRGPGPGV